MAARTTTPKEQTHGTTNTTSEATETSAAASAAGASFDLDALLERVRAAQAAYATFTQEQVDAIFRHAAMAANIARIDLAQAAVEETGMGVLEDKVIKNHFAAEFIFNKYKDTATCGVI
ncbi:MAG: hypothetical protein ACOC1U_07735, partial [Spirochaetota bacterium]